MRSIAKGYSSDSAGYSRRKVLRTVGAGALATVTVGLMGCGGSRSGGSTKRSSSALTAATDTSKQAKAGGTFRDFAPNDVKGFDPQVQGGAALSPVLRAYSRLMMYAPKYLGKEPTDVMIPDLAENFEYLPDKVQVTYKLRPNAKWDSRAPTNSRPVDGDDVLFSWKRFSALGTTRTALDHSLSPAAPIDSITAPDKLTVVVKLAIATADLVSTMNERSKLIIAPREADGGFDPRSEMRGSSAWIMTDYKPSQSFSFAKNPNWYRNDRPFIEKWEAPIITEYAQQHAQFRAGNVLWGGVKQEDVIATWHDRPDLLIYQGDLTTSVVPTLRFGLADPKAPWWDQRVRQGLSMLLDRETWGRTFGAADDFEAAGLPVDIKWGTHGGAGAIDVKASDFGSNGKYYKYNPTEAKKLLAAAGYADGFSTEIIYPSTYSTLFSQFDAIVGMLNDGGITTKTRVSDFNSEFYPKMRFGHGAWDGIAMDTGNSAQLVDYLWRRYNSAGDVFPGFDRDGKDRLRGDPKVNDLTDRMKSEFDHQRQEAIIKELLQYLALTMYEIPGGAYHANFVPVWPAVQNYNTYVAYNAPEIESQIHLWLDPSHPPLNRGS